MTKSFFSGLLAGIIPILLHLNGCSSSILRTNSAESGNNTAESTEQDSVSSPEFPNRCWAGGDHLVELVANSGTGLGDPAAPFDYSIYQQTNLVGTSVRFLGNRVDQPSQCPQTIDGLSEIQKEIGKTLQMDMFRKVLASFNVLVDSPQSNFVLYITLSGSPKLSTLDKEKSGIISQELMSGFSYHKAIVKVNCEGEKVCYNLILSGIDMSNSNPHNNILVALSDGIFQVLADWELEKRKISLEQGSGVLSAGIKVFSDYIGTSVDQIDETLKLGNYNNSLIFGRLLQTFGSKPEGFNSLSPVQRQQLFEERSMRLIFAGGIAGLGSMTYVNEQTMLFHNYQRVYSDSKVLDFASIYDLQTNSPLDKTLVSKSDAYKIATEMLNRLFRSVGQPGVKGNHLAVVWNIEEVKKLDDRNNVLVETFATLSLSRGLNTAQLEEHDQARMLSH
jgi:hypothetical protein